MGEKLSIQAQHDLQAAIAALNQLAKSIGTVSDEEKKNAGAAGAAGRETDKLSQSQKKASASSSELSSALGGLKSALVALGLGQFVKESTDLFVQQQQAINIIAASTGDIESATREYERWREVTETLGIEFNRSSIIYARFLTTAKQAGVPIENARAAADGLAIAQRAMNLSSYEAELAFRALGQIANKTVVNMEELRQQLGERVAGVMDAVSKKMGITTKQLFQLTETGELSAKVFFEKFGPAMAEAFKDQAITNADSLAANLERIGNAGRRIQIEFSTGFADELNRAMKETKESTKGAEDGFRSMGQGFGVLIGWIGDFLGQFHKIRAIFAEFQGWLLDGAAAVVEFAENSVQGLSELYGLVATAAEKVGLDKLASRARDAQKSLQEGGKAAGETAEDLRLLANASRDVAKEQLQAQRAIDKAGEASNKAAEEINALADGAKTTGEGFNILDPAIAKFTDRINKLGEDTNVAVEALRRLMESGPLSEAQLAAARSEVEKLVKAWDFKNIPPDLKALAEKLGVATEETKKNTKATQEQKKAYDELLKSLKAVRDEFQKSADEAQKAADENAKRIAELDQAILNPEDFNELYDRRAKQVQLDREAREAKEKLLYAQEDLNAAELAAAAASGEFSSGVGTAKAALDAFSGSATTAVGKLGELGQGFSGVGSLAALLGGKEGIGPAGTFGLGPTALPGAPGGLGAGSPFAPGKTPVGVGGINLGAAATPLSLLDQAAFAQGVPGGRLDAFGNPIPSQGNQGFGLLTRSPKGGNNTGLPNTSPGIPNNTQDIIAGIIADQILADLGKSETWEDAAQQEAISKAALAAATGIIGSGKDGGAKPGPLTEITDATGKVTGLTNLSQEGEDLNEILGDTKDNVDDINSSAEDFASNVKDWVNAGREANDQIEPIAAGLDAAAAAAQDLPDGVREAVDALKGASKAGVDYTEAIQRADGETGKLGFTADAVAGSIAEAAGAATDFGSEIANESRTASKAMGDIGESAGRTVEEVKKLREELEAINRLLVGGGNKPIGLGDLEGIPR